MPALTTTSRTRSTSTASAARLTRRQLLLAGAGCVGALTLGALPLGDSVAVAPTDALPADAAAASGQAQLALPGLDVTTGLGRQLPGLIFLAPYNAPAPALAGPVIVDATGEPVWEYPLPRGTVATNLRVQSYRGEPVLTWWEGSIQLGHGVGQYVIANTRYERIATIQAANGLRGDLHEFQITSRDTALLTAYRVLHADLSSVGGSRQGTIQDSILQELDIASGRVLLEWHSLGAISLQDSYWPVGENWDFFHINSIDVDSDGNLLVSARSTHAVYKLQRTGGEIMWRLGGRRSDFAMAPGAGFAWQHDARRQPDGTITIFDNGASPAVEKQSRAIALTVDESHRRATLAAQFTHQPQALSATSQGSMQRLPGGNVFVGWGAEPYVSEFAPDGRLLYDAHLPAAYESYRALCEPWTGAPAAPPDLTARRGRGAVTVSASWNGDTRTDRWVVLAGSSARTMTPVATGRRGGFATAMQVRTSEPLLAVRALNRAGATIGQSAAVRV